MPKYHGRDSVVYMSTSGATDAQPVSGISEWTLDMDVDTVEVTSFDSVNKEFVQGLPNLTGTLAGVWKDDVTVIKSARKSTTPVKMYIYHSKNAPTKYHYGTAWVGSSQQSGVSDAVRLTVSFSAAGPWDEM